MSVRTSLCRLLPDPSTAHTAWEKDGDRDGMSELEWVREREIEKEGERETERDRQ